MTTQVQRSTGRNIDRAADRALVNARFRRLVDLDLANDLRGQQGVVEGPARLIEDEPVRRGDRLAVQQGAVQRRVGAQDRNLFALPEGAVDRDARNDGDGLGHVRAGELAHILGGDDVDNGVGVALGRDRLLQRRADARDDDFVDRGGRRVLGGGGAGDQRQGAD
ncbi:hypothetical protein D3C80_871100 [compost metagenome]